MSQMFSLQLQGECFGFAFASLWLVNRKYIEQTFFCIQIMMTMIMCQWVKKWKTFCVWIESFSMGSSVTYVIYGTCEETRDGLHHGSNALNHYSSIHHSTSNIMQNCKLNEYVLRVKCRGSGGKNIHKFPILLFNDWKERERKIIIINYSSSRRVWQSDLKGWQTNWLAVYRYCWYWRVDSLDG